MSNFQRLAEERPVVLTGVYSPGAVIIPVSTGIRIFGSTTTPLLAGAAYTSALLSVQYFKYVTGTIFADQAGTLYIDHSADGVNFDGIDLVSYIASTPTRFGVETAVPYARVRFVNGLSAQGVFRLFYFGKLI